MSNRSIQLIPSDVLLRASRAINFDGIGNWTRQFEEHYNVKLGDLFPADSTCTIDFPSDKDYVMFMLKWG